MIDATSIALSSAAGAGLFTLIYKIAEKIFDNYLAHGSLVTSDKRQIADEIIKICSEGDRKAFQKNAKDGQNILYIARQVGVFNENAEKDLKEYQLLWELAAATIQRRKSENLQFYRELAQRAREKRDVLLKLAKSWKK